MNPQKQILIIEDDKYYSGIYKKKLSSLGFNVRTANNGKQGIEEIEKAKPDLILLDLVMPEMDGFEVLNEIRKNTDMSDFPIIVLTVLGQEEDAKRAKELGATDFYVKTDITMDQLVEKIREYLT